MLSRSRAIAYICALKTRNYSNTPLKRNYKEHEVKNQKTDKYTHTPFKSFKRKGKIKDNFKEKTGSLIQFILYTNVKALVMAWWCVRYLND